MVRAGRICHRREAGLVELLDLEEPGSIRRTPVKDVMGGVRSDGALSPRAVHESAGLRMLQPRQSGFRM